MVWKRRRPDRPASQSLFLPPPVVFAATGNAIKMATKAMNALEIVFDTIKMKTIVVKINVISVTYIYPIGAQC